MRLCNSAKPTYESRAGSSILIRLPLSSDDHSNWISADVQKDFVNNFLNVSMSLREIYI